MQKKLYTILSFNFGNYDLIRDPKVIDPNADYIMITDRPVKSNVWRVAIDPKLVSRNPIYSAYYVRYHPFEYVNTKYVIIVDASVQINDLLRPIIAEFIKYDADYSPMLTNYETDETKAEFFVKKLGRISEKDSTDIKAFIKRMGQENWKGSIGCAFTIFRNTSSVRALFRNTWRFLLATGKYGVPNRMDEVILHKLLYRYRKKLKLYITSIQIIQSTYMTYCIHGKNEAIPLYPNYNQMYYLCNIPVTPARFSKIINYPRSYRYKTEAMLLTKHLNPSDLEEWLDWHINRCGFERIHVFDNESDYDVRTVCDKFGNRVTYDLVEGQPRQYKLYDEYINWRSNAEWVMPIDDDEYLDIGEFKTVYDAISYYRRKFAHMDMLAVRWKHLFPENFNEERTGKVLDYCTVENPELAEKFMRLGDTTVKAIVHRYGKIHYEETWENPSGGHVPKHSCFLGALTCDGRAVLGCGIKPFAGKDETVSDERIRLLHCRYKGPSDWKKNHGPGTKTVSDAVPHERQYTNMRFE